MKRFAGLYIVVLAISIMALFFSRNEFSQKFILEIAGNPLVWVIAGFFGTGLLMSLAMFINTAKELKLLNAISQGDGKILEGEISKKTSDSIIIKLLRKFYTANKFDWPEKARNNLEDYLEEVLFYWTNWLGFIGKYLPALGMLGTVCGMIAALLDKAAGGDMYSGVANAIGTTALGLIGSLILSTLNQVVVSERKMQLKTLIVLLQMKTVEIKGGEKNV